MTVSFEAFKSLNREPHISWIAFLSAALAGWLMLEITFAVFAFILPHGPHFAPEIGPMGTFFVFSLVYTVGYIPLFVVLAVPLKLLIAKVNSNPTNRFLPLVSGGLFAIVSGGFECLNSSARNALPVATLFAVAGVVCMTVLQVKAK